MKCIWARGADEYRKIIVGSVTWSWQTNLSSTSVTWASRISNYCRLPNIRLTLPGAISRSGSMAATWRFGTPDELRHLVDRCHQAGLGVIVDWVPAHFPRDPNGLGRFDGTALYEHEDPRRGEHADWGTLVFNYGRSEVLNYLISNALFWVDEFHFDGLRVDAVASMLYLDYSREADEWLPNEYGGNENLEAVAFLRRLNEEVHQRGAVTIAEESTAWPGVSRPTYAGGLGFSYKWNMGWMNDTLSYMERIRCIVNTITTI